MKFLKGLFKFKEKFYFSSSEFVSPGHPDRLCDDIAAIVIQDIQKVDGANSHAAVEVFITHDSIIFGGEVTTSLDINLKYLRSVVKKGFRRAGYIPEMRRFWTKDECLLPSNLKIINKICSQSPDIAQGTTDKGIESGWNDQGIYFSSADNSNETKQGYSHYVASLIGEELRDLSRITIFEGGKFTNGVILGPDNKCVVTVKTKQDGFTPVEVTAVTVAVAYASTSNIDYVRDFVRSKILELAEKNSIVISNDCNWIINGTGRFVIHGPISDTSMTGRKVSVNHPSAGPVWSNKMIGGGSLVKPMHASDLILNIMSRYIANIIVQSGLSTYAIVGCSSAIGTHGIQSIFIKGDKKFDNKYRDAVIRYFKYNFKWTPIALATHLGFFSENFDFGLVVDTNFFGNSRTQPWEDSNKIDKEVKHLKSYLS